MIPLWRLLWKGKTLAPVYQSAVRHSKAQKQRKVEVEYKNPHLKTLIRQKKLEPKDKALNYFDIYYKNFYGQDYHSIRLGLLSRPRYAALLNNLGNREETERELCELGCSPLFSPRNFAQEDTEPVFGKTTSLYEHEDEIEEEREVLDSMKIEEAQDRVISPSVRISRKGETISSMHEFVPVSKLKGMEDFVDESEHYSKYEKISHSLEFPLQFYKSLGVSVPVTLKAYVFPPGDVSRFPKPKCDIHNIYNYYCMDGASLLPVLALDLKKENKVLDMCSGPGGKALAIRQTLLPSKIVCNDSSTPRLRRVRNVFNQYFGSTISDGIEVEYTSRDGEDYFVDHEEAFDRVLCDVPCYTDRVVVKENDNNIFKPKNTTERIRLPQLQAALLMSALLCVKPGGYVVYSTCTLSPAQNDGVVHAALKEIWEKTRNEYALCDLSEAMESFSSQIKFSKQTRYGQQVLPILHQNFGPMYFAKLKRLKKQ